MTCCDVIIELVFAEPTIHFVPFSTSTPTLLFHSICPHIVSRDPRNHLKTQIAFFSFWNMSNIHHNRLRIIVFEGDLPIQQHIWPRTQVDSDRSPENWPSDERCRKLGVSHWKCGLQHIQGVGERELGCSYEQLLEGGSQFGKKGGSLHWPKLQNSTVCFQV